MYTIDRYNYVYIVCVCVRVCLCVLYGRYIHRINLNPVATTVVWYRGLHLDWDDCPTPIEHTFKAVYRDAWAHKNTTSTSYFIHK